MQFIKNQVLLCKIFFVYQMKYDRIKTGQLY